MKGTLEVIGSMALVLALGACSRDYPTAPNSDDEVVMSPARSQAQVFKAVGDVDAGVNDYREALGTLNLNFPGSQPDGRREVNWDAVPALFTNTNDFPGDFFNQPVAGRARGVLFSTPGTGFRVSDVNFADLNADFDRQFSFFSPLKTFAAVGSNAMTVTFFVPGSDVPAASTGFGVVFSDVDRNGSASIKLFDAEGKSLGRFSAPASSGAFSFVGVAFPKPIVARVEIVSGQAAIDGDAIDVDDRDHGPARDLVIMDDFIFGEPIATSDETGAIPSFVATR